MNISTRTALIGILSGASDPMPLASIKKEFRDGSESGSTLFRTLQRLIEEGIVAKQDERYSLVKRGATAIRSADLLRLSNLDPVYQKPERGLHLSVYADSNTNKTMKSVNMDYIAEESKDVITNILKEIDPALAKGITMKEIPEQLIPQFLGMKFSILISFDGTDFAILSDEVIKSKRKEALQILREKKTMSSKELGSRLGLNDVELKRVLNPLLSLEYAQMDDAGNVSLSIEVYQN
ncbi:MAG: hypothetical protein ABSE82_14720 [Nitrososphaerales archaeon]|jgi:predicted transcriptional regulator